VELLATDADRKIDQVNHHRIAGDHAARRRRHFPKHYLRVPLAPAPQGGGESRLASGNHVYRHAHASAPRDHSHPEEIGPTVVRHAGER
jgi:hypothetical protein